MTTVRCMPTMTLAYALFVECPLCGQQIDVGESSVEVTAEGSRQLVSHAGDRRMEGDCPRCRERVELSLSKLRSRIRN